jgi:hypothetical protein
MDAIEATGEAAAVEQVGAVLGRLVDDLAGTAGELDGYYVYDAAGPEAAIAFAARIPVARFGGTIEVRPMLER